MALLNTIDSPKEVKALFNANPAAIEQLADEIRQLLVRTVSKSGGHLASNLGVVELTMALHLSFNSPIDSIIFDVGHQSYVNKILTGRRDEFSTLRTKGGLSGFPKRAESQHDAFDTGHASTSISAALGMLRAKCMQGDDSYAVAVIGDAALIGGMVFEALNDAGQSGLPLIVVLNDNSMAISKTVGAVGSHLSKLRTSKPYLSLKTGTHRLLAKIPGIGEYLASRLERLKNRIKFFLLPDMMFESFGFKYLGSIDGHNIKELCHAFEVAKRLNRPVIVHTVTQKGRGYKPAEDNPVRFHGVGKFNVCNGIDRETENGSNSKKFGDALVELAYKDTRIAAITAAMPEGTGLTRFSQVFPDRFFDVGIAEEHAVTMAAGMAVGGLKPVVAIYSTFLQRSYDQILHDVCLQKLPVVFAVDRAGLVGSDGETHQGVYDIAYLLTMPNLVIFSPASLSELNEMLELALNTNSPTAIRYGRSVLPMLPLKTPIEIGKWEVVKEISAVTVIASGRMVATAIRAAAGLNVGIINARFIKPMDEALLTDMKNRVSVVITIEDGIKSIGFGTRIAAFMSGSNVRVESLGVPDEPVSHATLGQQDEQCGISPGEVRETILMHLKESKIV